MERYTYSCNTVACYKPQILVKQGHLKKQVLALMQLIQLENKQIKNYSPDTQIAVMTLCFLTAVTLPYFGPLFCS